jgi:hypothetical protein
MTSLESIVLPLAESRALVEHGAVLDTALSWAGRVVDYGRTIVLTTTEEANAQVTIHKEYESRHPEGIRWPKPIPAPVLSELLDAIRAKVGDAELHSYNVNTMVDIGERTWEMLGDYIGVARRYKIVERASAPTDLLAAAALLMEASK